LCGWVLSAVCCLLLLLLLLLLLRAGVAFVVGQDTAERLVMEKYYGGTSAGLLAAFESVADAGCSFIVAGRVNDDNGEETPNVWRLQTSADGSFVRCIFN